MVTTKLRVLENGDLELPPRPRKRLRFRGRPSPRRVLPASVDAQLELSTLIA